MIPKPFEYAAPHSVEEAIQLLRNNPQAKVLAGGHSLIPTMKLRLADPPMLVDIGRISSLRHIEAKGETIHIGALTTHHEVEASELLRKKAPLLCEAAAVIGDLQVRNRGTIGGSLAHADPAADYPAAILALDAHIVVLGPHGERVIRAQEFFKGLFEADVRAGEVLTEIRVHGQAARTGHAYHKVKQPASGFAIVGVAAQLTLDEQQHCTHAAVGITGLAAVPFRARAVESFLKGKKLDDKVLQEVSARATEHVNDPLEDMHASGDFRLHLTRIWMRRVLEMAAARARKA